ncbi:MAG: DUF4832 domain-containing protein [Opitutales bacterium]
MPLAAQRKILLESDGLVVKKAESTPVSIPWIEETTKVGSAVGQRPSPSTGSAWVVVNPKPYERALRNPLKGFTSGSEWETLRHTYIRWNELENRESDGIERIRQVCDERWEGFAEANVKAIPRVYLHYPGREKGWPSDMRTDDYTSEQFQKRVVRLIERLGKVWDNDPRVAFVEMGLFGKWGEHHGPSPTPEMEKIVGDAFRRAFTNKLVSVRHPWNQFRQANFGVYWDSWAHYQQMWPHGHEIAKLNKDAYWKHAYIGGEVAYDWGDWKIQAGENPTVSVSKSIHRDYIINSIHWLHCTQLRWISGYDATNAEAREGAEQIQKALGYRFILDEVGFPGRIDAGESFGFELKVRNEGSAPFYYDWPLELSLLDPETLKPVWKANFREVDIREWLPGEGWPEPEWKPYPTWPGKVAEWLEEPLRWRTPPRQNQVQATFHANVAHGRYILAVAILNPAGDLPSVRFATANYLNGGRHPIGMIAVGEGEGGPLPDDFRFDDPHADRSLHYIPPPAGFDPLSTATPEPPTRGPGERHK